MRAYEYRHVVLLEETSVVGNVYYANHVRWQGYCREMFLKEYAPQILDDFEHGLVLVTTRVSCEYYGELRAFDEIIIRMYAAELSHSRLTMTFEYIRVDGAQQELVARGEQQVACMRNKHTGLVPEPIPVSLRKALASYRDSRS